MDEHSIHVCAETGFGLVAASPGDAAWRVAKERYVASGGITAVVQNTQIGPLPGGAPDRRGRFDTLGRTVYFATTAETAFAETLQAFRRSRIAIEADAQAAGLDCDEYVRLVTLDAEAIGISPPWMISADWEMAHCLHRVQMPAEGWWVSVSDKNTIRQVGLDLAESLRSLNVEFLTLANFLDESRAVTTVVADHIRSRTLFDGSEPLGIQFPSKTGYGDCYAWWDRRADLGLTPGNNDPRTLEDMNVGVPSLYQVAGELGILRPVGALRSTIR